MIAHWYGPGPGFELQIQWCAGEIPALPSANEFNLGVPRACNVTSVVVLPKKKKNKKKENYGHDFLRRFLIGCGLAFLSFFPDSVTYYRAPPMGFFSLSPNRCFFWGVNFVI